MPTRRGGSFVIMVRAQASLIAYSTALDYVHRLPHAVIVERLEAKIREKQEQLEILDNDGRMINASEIK